MFCKCCNLPKSKICSECTIEKSLDKFEKGRKQCKECRKLYDAKRYREAAEAKINKQVLNALVPIAPHKIETIEICK